MIKLGVKNDQVERQLELSEKELADPVVSQSVEQSVDQSLPKSHLYKRLKKLSSFKKIKKDYKMEHQKSIFVSDLKELFKHLSNEEHKYDMELLTEVLNACEEYFIYGSKQERDLSKKEVITELMLPFFESEQILQQFCLAVSHKVKKSNVVRRVMKRVFNFFF